jgi:hypothetical protein
VRVPVSIAILALAATLAVSLTGCAPATLDESEMPRIMQLREDQLRFLGSISTVPEDTPIPELVRWVTDHEAPALITSCLQEAGFDVELLGSGLVSFDAVPDDQADAARLAQWTCQAQYSTDPRGSLPLTEDQIRMLYDYDNTTMRECLESHGIFVDVAPNFDIYREALRAHEDGWSAWSYVDLSEIGQDAWDDLEAECPHDVGPEGLYGPPLPQP